MSRHGVTDPAGTDPAGTEREGGAGERPLRGLRRLRPLADRRLAALWLAGLVGCWIAMAVGTHLPPKPDTGEVSLDKPLHFGAFFGLAGLLAVVLWQRGRSIWLAVPILLAYALVDELSQVPFGREADPWDFVCDAAGILLGTVVVSCIVADDADT